MKKKFKNTKELIQALKAEGLIINSDNSEKRLMEFLNMYGYQRFIESFKKNFVTDGE
jgi:hypothetical protein